MYKAFNIFDNNTLYIKTQIMKIYSYLVDSLTYNHHYELHMIQRLVRNIGHPQISGST